MPGLEDNYYANVMDFLDNKIAVVLANTLFLHNGVNIE